MSGKRHRPPARGQALVLFAISATVLFGLVGLSIDGLRVTIAYQQAQRAAEAAALAGVVYLPQYPTGNANAPDGNNATNRALQEATKNGFTNSSTITVTPQVGTIITLRVSILVNTALTLSAITSGGSATNIASATATILPPVALGDGSNAFGDTSQLVPGITSPSETKGRGDPYSPLCDEGWSEGSDTVHANAASDLYFTSILHIATNIPQYPTGANCSPGSPGNPDHIPSGFGGLATSASAVPSGESYLITLPPGASGYSVWVWNPRFVYSGSSDQNSTLFPSQENTYPYGSSGITDVPAMYPQIAYGLYKVPELYNRSTDRPLAAIWPSSGMPNVTPYTLAGSQVAHTPALDANNIDLFWHHCFGGPWNLLSGGTYPSISIVLGCLSSSPSDVNNWVQMGATTLSSTMSTPAYYRLTVDMSVGQGRHGYGVRVCASTTFGVGNCPAGGANITAWNASTAFYRSSTLSRTYPLMNIPASYAGRQVSLSLFNPGTGSGNMTLQIIPPAAGGTITYPSYLRLGSSGTGTTIRTSVGSDNLYHGKWVRLTITLPPDYAGGQWQINWTGSTSAPNALMTVAANLIGKPIKLLPST